MPLTEAAFLTSPVQQQVGAMFAPATAMLSSALNSAVESGRRMVDLQSHQEDIFMTEREKLRLASERKGLEARRMFESDRAFDEDVLKDRRNFAEDMFRDERNFGLKSEIERGQLSLARSGQALQRELGLGQLKLGAEENANKKTYYDTQAKIAGIKLQEAERDLNSNTYLGGQLDRLMNSPSMGASMDEQWAGNVLGVGTDYYRSGADMEAMTNFDMYDQDVQEIQGLVKNYTREQVEEIYPKMNPRQQAIANRILFSKGTIANKFNAGTAQVRALPSLAPQEKGKGGSTVASVYNERIGSNSISNYGTAYNYGGYNRSDDVLSVNRQGVGLLPDALTDEERRDMQQASRYINSGAGMSKF